MSAPVTTLLETQLRRWFGAKGFAIVTAAALLPLVLTGAWVGTHQADVAAESITWTPQDPAPGDAVNFTAVVRNTGDRPVGAFNASLHVGRVQGNSLLRPTSNTTSVDGLAPGEEATIRLQWTARSGAFVVLLDVDPEDDVGEVEEIGNNQKVLPVTVRTPAPSPEDAPDAPLGLTGNESANATADVSVALSPPPEDLNPGENATFTATFTNNGPDDLTNATLTLRVGQTLGGAFTPFQSEVERDVTLPSGESTTVELPWSARLGTYWVQAFAEVDGAHTHDPDGGNNHQAEGVAVQPQGLTEEDFPEPPERLTLKSFYYQILTLLELRILLPFIALFYAAGVVSDEREAGTLPYLLTRPVPRWLLPLTKFAASYVVAAAAVTIGIVATFGMVFGFASGVDISLLTAPLALSLLTLFAYGAFFIFLGVVADRPYLIGAAFVIGWEAIVGNLVPWVENLTISHHVTNLVNAWWDAEALQFVLFPEGQEALRAFLVVLGAGVAFLAAASVAMKRREFPQ